MSGPGQGGRGGGWSPLHFRPPSPYAPSPPPRFGSPGMPMFATRLPHMPAPRPRWPSPLPPGISPPPIPPSPRPFRMPMHPPSPAPTRCATPDFFRGISPYVQLDMGPTNREYEYVGVPLEPPPLPKNYEPDEEESGPSTAEIIANQSQDYIDEKLAEYQATIYLLQGMFVCFTLALSSDEVRICVLLQFARNVGMGNFKRFYLKNNAEPFSTILQVDI